MLSLNEQIAEAVEIARRAWHDALDHGLLPEQAAKYSRGTIPTGAHPLIRTAVEWDIECALGVYEYHPTAHTDEGV